MTVKTEAKFDLRRRLNGYWRMELFAALLIPFTTIFLMLVFQAAFGILLIGCFVPMCGLLVVGGLYWRAKLAAIDGAHAQLVAVIARCRILKSPALILTLLALALVTSDWLGLVDVSRSSAELLAATLCSLLAAAEYFNYYHRQLQHFDHLPDFQRFLAGKGLRKSHLAKDLCRLRRLSRKESSQ